MNNIDCTYSGNLTGRSSTATEMFFTHVAILLTLFLWIYGDYRFVGYHYGTLIKPRIFGIPFNIVNLMIPIIFAYYMFKDYRQKLISKRNVIIIILFIFYWLIGMIYGNDRRYIETDTLMLIAFFSGYAFMWLMWKSGKSEFYLFLMMLCCSIVILLKSWSDLSYSSFALQRYTSVILWNYALSLYFLIGINTVWSVVNKRKAYLIGSILSLSILFYCGVLLGATRSLALALVVLICFAALSSISVLYKQSGWHSKLKRVLLCVVFILFIYIIYRISIGTLFSDYTIIANRMVVGNSWYIRLEEAADLLRQLNMFDLLIGRGLCATVPTALGQTHIPHIAILWFLFAFGLIPFIYVIFTLYVKIPLTYLKSIHSIKRTGKIHPVLVIAPGLFAWSVSLLISGGISYYGFFSIGITLCFYENFNRFCSVKNLKG